MPKDKVKGLIGNSINSGLVGSIIHHTDRHKLYLGVTAAFVSGENPAETMKYRGKILEQDMTTMYSSLNEILDIAKQKGYEDIRQIIEDREYEHGHDFKD